MAGDRMVARPIGEAAISDISRLCGPRSWTRTLLLVLGMVVAMPAAAGIVTIRDIPQGLPEGLAYGKIIQEIRITGNDHTDEDVIRMALKSRLGHPYTEENARLDLLWISRLGAFTSVSFATEPVPEGIILEVLVTEATPYIPSLSIGLTQENGLEVGPAFSSSNLLGTAARASVYARVGGATNVGLKYADPLIPARGLNTSFQFQFFHRERTNELLSYQETTDELFLEVKGATNDNARSGLRLRYLALKSDRDGVTLDSDNYDHIPSLGYFIQNDSRNGVYPTNGWFAEVEVAKYGVFGGAADFWRLDVDVRRYLPLPLLGPRHSLAVNSFAALVAGEPGRGIPAHQEFFIGGTNSVRGWTLGSRRGQNQWLITSEYWFRLMEQKEWGFWFVKWPMGLQLGAFFDLGTAWSEYEDLEDNMIAGGGLGFRLTMPVITMIRFDVAYGEDDFELRFFIGGAEKAVAQKERVR